MDGMEEKLYKIIGLTVADVRMAMGLLPSNTSYDSFIQEKLEKKADLILEDIFTINELRDFTVNQKARACEGLAMVLAGECLEALPNSMVLGGDSSGGGQSVSLGPISLGAWNGTSGLKGVREYASSLRENGLDVLNDLHMIENLGYMEWKAVGSSRGVRRRRPELNMNMGWLRNG